ncbi:erythromycin resistance leader peptide [Cytobacillus firmus]|uniref:Uncharacterized protein n=1 Tax=Ornithinibacillus caprae TaxID=2678566 RepID=A0A6N8FKT6_9BACI|nr:erythromycin resistance leader peptide [Priestia flexa]MUK88944.1 hypothetical protein [Ornithinibacillus caprae]UBF35156.1 erythromycin resistance leader peptide [Bacillus sp. PM8313]USK41436.1 erythromycin resistance leader peptide [Cytobacillus firmus]USK52536.1 erythromycin resistance leader peptide [Bacillus sp. CMF12]
MRLRFPTLNQ